jgi:NADH dehydrogenase FAD-containing subunit
MDDVRHRRHGAVLDVAANHFPHIRPGQQQGAYACMKPSRSVRRQPARHRFRYRDRGLLATVGRKTAVIAFAPAAQGMVSVVDLGHVIPLLISLQSADRHDAVVLVLCRLERGAWFPSPASAAKSEYRE